jgi:hypothetical protein
MHRADASGHAGPGSHLSRTRQRRVVAPMRQDVAQRSGLRHRGGEQRPGKQHQPVPDHGGWMSRPATVGQLTQRRTGPSGGHGGLLREYRRPNGPVLHKDAVEPNRGNDVFFKQPVHPAELAGRSELTRPGETKMLGRPADRRRQGHAHPIRVGRVRLRPFLHLRNAAAPLANSSALVPLPRAITDLRAPERSSPHVNDKTPGNKKESQAKSESSAENRLAAGRVDVGPVGAIVLDRRP